MLAVVEPIDHETLALWRARLETALISQLETAADEHDPIQACDYLPGSLDFEAIELHPDLELVELFVSYQVEITSRKAGRQGVRRVRGRRVVQANLDGELDLDSIYFLDGILGQ